MLFVMATMKWSDDEPSRQVNAADVEQLWAEVEAQVSRPVVLLIEDGDAEIGAVVGAADGTVLTYRPAGYAATGTGSLLSVADPAAADADRWEPPVTAFYFGHHTEFPRWSLVPRSSGVQALAQFCRRPDVPPSAIVWESD